MSQFKKLQAKELIQQLGEMCEFNPFVMDELMYGMHNHVSGSPSSDDFIINGEYNWESYHSAVDSWNEELLKKHGIGEIKLVEDYGGEDCGSTYYKVYHFIDHDIYIRLDGWYASYVGCDFDTWDESVCEVKPKEKVVTVYEKNIE